MIYKIVAGDPLNNNGGTIRAAAGSQTNDNFNLLQPNTADVIAFASTVVEGVNTDKALSAGTFAKNTQRPVGKKVTGVINTILNTYLLTGAAEPTLIQSVKKSKVCNTGTCVDGVRSRLSSTAFRDNKYNIYTGKFELGYPTVQSDEFEADAAANVTRENPGSLVFNTQKGSSTVNYSKKTG